MVKEQRKEKIKSLIGWMFWLSLLAIIIFSYLLFLHYSESESFCDFAPGLSCDIVNKSIYSEFPPGSGLPVSAMGIITFLIVLLLLYVIKEDKKIKLSKTIFNRKKCSSLLFYLMAISFLFALYLVYTELILILSICILCVVADIIIVIMLILSYKLKEVCYDKNE